MFILIKIITDNKQQECFSQNHDLLGQIKYLLKQFSH